MGLMFIALPPKPLPALGVGISSVAILGDSIVQQMTPVQGGMTPPINGAALYGVSGQTTADIAARVSQAVGYSHVLIEGGINDFIFELSPDVIVANYATMLEALTDAQQVRIVGVTRVDPAALGSGYTFLNNAAIDAVNARLIDLCAAYDNCRPVEGAMTLDVSGHTPDGIHKTNAGYAAWAAQLAAGL